MVLNFMDFLMEKVSNDLTLVRIPYGDIKQILNKFELYVKTSDGAVLVKNYSEYGQMLVTSVHYEHQHGIPYITSEGLFYVSPKDKSKILSIDGIYEPQLLRFASHRSHERVEQMGVKVYCYSSFQHGYYYEIDRNVFDTVQTIKGVTKAPYPKSNLFQCW